MPQSKGTATSNRLWFLFFKLGVYMAEERQFKGVWIDKEIWLDKRLNALEKVILTEIDSLDNENGCSASNHYLAEFCQCSETKVSTAISKLIELEYIYVKSFDGRTRILKSRLSKIERQGLNNLKADIKKVKAINIDNNKDNNINIYSPIIDYLNEKAGTHYRQVESNYKHIKARLQDFSVDDLKTVIDKKCKEWIGTEFEKYLTPETLFRPGNFEKYLNQIIRPPKLSRTELLSARKREYTKEQFDAMYDNLEEVLL